MNAEHERTWRELIADAAEQKRRADLFPELVEALDDLVAYLPQGRWISQAENTAVSLLVRCRKP